MHGLPFYFWCAMLLFIKHSNILAENLYREVWHNGSIYMFVTFLKYFHTIIYREIRSVEPALTNERGSFSLLSKSVNMKATRVELTSETALNQLSSSSKVIEKMTTHPTDLKRWWIDGQMSMYSWILVVYWIMNVVLNTQGTQAS